jgi:hypothetical protein
MRTCPYCHREYPNACEGCGEPIEQPVKGRPRKWCRRAGCQTLRRRSLERRGDAQNAQSPAENPHSPTARWNP